METIKIDITILEPVEKVWDYFNDTQHVKNWYFADETWYCKSAENNVVTGGRFDYRLESKKENFGFNFSGIYDEVTKYSSIKSRLDDGRKVLVEFEKIDANTTKVIETFEPEDDNLLDMQRQGWYAILNNFHKYVENN